MKILDLHTTPNPAALKFVVDQTLTTTTEPLSVEEGDDTEHHLASKLLGIEDVKAVFIHGSWVTLRFSSQDVAQDREVLKAVGDILRDHEIDEMFQQETHQLESEDPRVSQIQDVLQKDVLPYLNSHGGSVKLVDLEDDQVFLQYMGACGGCPASTSATLRGIENILKDVVDPRLEVILVG